MKPDIGRCGECDCYGVTCMFEETGCTDCMPTELCVRCLRKALKLIEEEDNGTT